MLIGYDAKIIFRIGVRVYHLKFYLFASVRQPLLQRTRM